MKASLDFVSLQGEPPPFDRLPDACKPSVEGYQSPPCRSTVWWRRDGGNREWRYLRQAVWHPNRDAVESCSGQPSSHCLATWSVLVRATGAFDASNALIDGNPGDPGRAGTRTSAASLSRRRSLGVGSEQARHRLLAIGALQNADLRAHAATGQGLGRTISEIPGVLTGSVVVGTGAGAAGSTSNSLRHCVGRLSPQTRCGRGAHPDYDTQRHPGRCGAVHRDRYPAVAFHRRTLTHAAMRWPRGSRSSRWKGVGCHRKLLSPGRIVRLAIVRRSRQSQMNGRLLPPRGLLLRLGLRRLLARCRLLFLGSHFTSSSQVQADATAVLAGRRSEWNSSRVEVASEHRRRSQHCC